jgi:diacylglycerol kinase (ATP)
VSGTRPCTFIYNPLSGSFSRQRRDEALAYLTEHGLAPRPCEVFDPETAARCAREACHDADNPLLIVAGGDGTINSVINGLEAGMATVAVLPFGTANVLAQELGLSSPEQALARIVAGVTRPVPVGCFTAGTNRRYFLLMAGIGVDGSVVKGVRTAEKRRFGKGAYFLSTLRQLYHWEHASLAVTTGEATISCHSVIVCKAAKYGGNIRLAPGISLFAPELRVFCIKSTSRRSYVKLLFRMLAGRGIDGPEVSSFAAQELEIRGTKPLQADGDYYLDTPVTITVIPEFIRVIV